MDVLVAIDAIDELIHRPRRRTAWDVRRLDPASFEQAIERLRTEIASAVLEPGRSSAMELTDRLEAIAQRTHHVPVVGGVMLSVNDVCDVLDDLRQVIPAAIIAQRKNRPS